MKVSISLSVAATIFATTIATTDAATTPVSRVVGYHTSSESSLTACKSQPLARYDIDTSLYTHLVYSRASIDPSTFALALASGSDGSWSKIANIKQNTTDLKVLLALSDVPFSSSSNDTSTFGHAFKAMLTGSGNDTVNVAEAQKRQTTFINSLSSTLTKYGFDGVDIDWAGETTSAPAYSKIGVHDELAMFLGNLKTKLADKLLTYTVAGSSQAMSDLGLCAQHTSTCFPRGIAAASQHLDFINLKAFDLHSQANVTSPSSALFHASSGPLFGSSVDSVISTFTANGFEPQHLNLAMGLQGKSYIIATGPAFQRRMKMLNAKPEQGIGYYLPATSQDSCSMMSYNEITNVANSSYYSVHFDNVTSTSFMYNSKDRTFITFDDPKSLQHKANMMTQRQLGGVGFYGIEMDTIQNEFQRNVLSAIEASCPAGASWPRSVPGFTASMTCPDYSTLSRTCGADGSWTTKASCGQASTKDHRRRLYSSLEKRDDPICNGASTNCDLPINKLTLPSTHNSGSAPFYFPDPIPQFVQDLTLASGEGLLQCAFNNQDKGLDLQVQDGIRGFDFELCYNLNMSTSYLGNLVSSIISGDSTFTVPVDCHGPGILGNFDILIDAYGYRMDDAFRFLKSTVNTAQDIMSIRLSSSPVASTADQVHHDTITIFADTFCNGDNINCPSAIKNYGAGNVTAGQSLANGANVLLLWQDDDWVNSNGYGSWVTNEGAVVQRTWSDPPINVNDVGSNVANICSGPVTLPLDLDLYGKYDPSALLTCLDTLAGANQANGTSVSSFVQQMTTQTCNGKDVAAIHLDRYEIFQSSDSQGRTFAAWVNEYNAGKPR